MLGTGYPAREAYPFERGFIPGSFPAVRSYLEHHGWKQESRSLTDTNLREVYSKPSDEGNWVCRVVLETEEIK